MKKAKSPANDGNPEETLKKTFKGGQPMDKRVRVIVVRPNEEKYFGEE